MAGNASRENGKRGGRPKGAKSPATLEREAVLSAYRQRVCKLADDLLDAELTVAKGCTYLFSRRKTKGAKEGKIERVTNPETIKRYLDGELENDPDEWFFMTTEKPDTQTIRGMFDRVFDKPPQAQAVSLSGEVTTVKKVVHEHRT